MMILRLLLIGIFLTLMGCSGNINVPEEDDSAGTGSQTGNAIVFGTVFKDSLPSENADIRLRKTSYLADPLTAESLAKKSVTKLDTLTNDDGTFQINGLDTGSYNLEIIDDSSGLVITFTIASTKDTIDLENNYLSSNASISGRVTYENSTGDPLYVQIQGLDKYSLVDSSTQQFVFNNLPYGEYKLVVSSISDTMINHYSEIINVESPKPLDTQYIVIEVIRDITENPIDTLLIKKYGNWKNSKSILLNTEDSIVKMDNRVYNFPILLRLDSTNFNFGEALVNGGDLRFTKSNDSVLSFEIESWNNTEKSAIVWVKVDTIIPNNIDSIIMYWGNDKAHLESKGIDVFDTDEGYTSVYHLDENPSDEPYHYQDQTINQAHATGKNISTTQNYSDGVIGKALDLEFNLKQYLEVNPSKESLFDFTNQEITISMWINVESFEDTVGWQSFIVKGNSTWRLQRENLSPTVEFSLNNKPTHVFSNTPLTIGNWHHLTATFQEKTATFYLDGKIDGVQFIESIGQSNFSVYIGEHPQNPGRSFDGLMDEIQILGTFKNKSWVRLNYENQKQGSSWISIPQSN